MVWGTAILYSGSLKSFVPGDVYLGPVRLVMRPAPRSCHGVQVGRVASVTGVDNLFELKLDIDADQVKYIPANVAAQISATTVFGRHSTSI